MEYHHVEPSSLAQEGCLAEMVALRPSAALPYQKSIVIDHRPNFECQTQDNDPSEV